MKLFHINLFKSKIHSNLFQEQFNAVLMTFPNRRQNRSYPMFIFRLKQKKMLHSQIKRNLVYGTTVIMTHVTRAAVNLTDVNLTSVNMTGVNLIFVTMTPVKLTLVKKRRGQNVKITHVDVSTSGNQIINDVSLAVIRGVQDWWTAVDFLIYINIL